MIESHLNEGNQKISEKLKNGQSITDASICLLYTTAAADDTTCVDHGGRSIN